MGDGHAVSNPVGATRPTGIQQDAPGLMGVYAVSQQVGVHRWLVRHERRTKAGAERGLRFHHSHLGTGQLGGETHHEVVHHLVPVEDRHRGEHTEGVSGQQHDGAGVRPLGAGGHMGIARERIGEAGVLGDGVVGEVELLGIGIGQFPAG